MRDYGPTEVGGFGITAADDLLFIHDVQLVHQTCDWAHVAFDDASVADFFDRQVDAGLRPEQFGRIWLHTHPGSCPQPSATDEETFERVFGKSDWAVMFILARDGQTYARLRGNVGPGTEQKLHVAVDFTRPFDGCNRSLWEQEYLDNVSEQKLPHEQGVAKPKNLGPDAFFDEWDDAEFGDPRLRELLRGY